jgi:uncharacterized damage-inducible protein DinB
LIPTRKGLGALDESIVGEPRDLPERKFGWWDMFVHPDEDPRADGGWNNDERSVLSGFLADRRLTLELKCAGLDAKQMARPSVPPSNLTLLGLVRHLAQVEHHWFRRVFAGEDVPWLYVGPKGEDLAFRVSADDEMVAEAWETWRSEVAHAEELVRHIQDLGELGRREPVPLRQVLVHLIREYAQHLGHADLIRERIDGRVGQ